MNFEGKIIIYDALTEEELIEFLEFMKKFGGFAWNVECNLSTPTECRVDSSGYVIKPKDKPEAACHQS